MLATHIVTYYDCILRTDTRVPLMEKSSINFKLMSIELVKL